VKVLIVGGTTSLRCEAVNWDAAMEWQPLAR
jgi:hypothetical protein